MSPDRAQCARPSLFRINTRRAQAGFRVLQAMAAGAGAPVRRCAQAIGRRRGIDGCSQDEFRTRAPGKNYKSIMMRTDSEACISPLARINPRHATPDSCDWSNRRFPSSPHRNVYFGSNPSTSYIPPNLRYSAIFYDAAADGFGMTSHWSPTLRRRSARTGGKRLRRTPRSSHTPPKH
jgi:hypothetical protein